MQISIPVVIPVGDSNQAMDKEMEDAFN